MGLSRRSNSDSSCKGFYFASPISDVEIEREG